MEHDFKAIAAKIIKEQERVIGPMAWIEAEKVTGLRVGDRTADSIIIEGEGTVVIDALVSQYERLFGRASHEVCRDAAASVIAGWQPADIPMSLR